MILGRCNGANPATLKQDDLSLLDLTASLYLVNKWWMRFPCLIHLKAGDYSSPAPSAGSSAVSILESRFMVMAWISEIRCLSCHPGSPHTRVQGDRHGWIRRHTTSSIYPRDTQGSVRKHCRAPILHWQRTQVQPDQPTGLCPIAKSQSCRVPEDSPTRPRSRCVPPKLPPEDPILGHKMGSAVRHCRPSCYSCYGQPAAPAPPPDRALAFSPERREEPSI